MRKANEVRRQETWNWLKTGKLGKGTEGMLMAGQEQALLASNIHRKKMTNRVFYLYVDSDEKERK